MSHIREPKPPEPFEQLEIPRRELPHLLAGHYRVYKDARNYTSVKAESALEALKASGMQQAYRIEREAIYLNNVLSLAALQQSTDVASGENVPAEVQGAAASSGPLSHEDVDKLLQS